jgi:hypothetical protein
MFKEIFDGLNVYADRLFTWIVGMSWEDFSYGAVCLSEADLCDEETKVERKYDRQILLKVKLKSLMEEVKIIRAFEERLKATIKRRTDDESAFETTLLRQMQAHRREEIRRESRATLLAYGYIRGRSYEQIEPKVDWYHLPLEAKARVERIAKMVNRYSVMDGTLLTLPHMEQVIRKWMGLNDRYEKV